MLVSEGKDFINEKFRDIWPILLGGLFVSVVLFLPEGILGGIPRLFKFLRLWFYRQPALSRRWNTVRVGIGLMYWGIVLLAVGISVRLLISVTRTPGGEVPAPEEEVIVGLLESIFTWFLAVVSWLILTGSIIAGSLMALVGQCICWAAPKEAPSKKFVVGSVALLGLFLIAGFLAVSAPLAELGRIFGLGGFGDLGAFLLVLLGLAATLSYLFFGIFLRGVALFYQNETLARSVKGFTVLYVAFFASNVFLNSMSEAAWTQPVLGRFLFIFKLVYAGMMVVLTVWFLRLLYQTHESINRPMAAG